MRNWPRRPAILSIKRLNELLDQEKFDEFAEGECAQLLCRQERPPIADSGNVFPARC